MANSRPIPRPSITEVFHHYGATVTGSDRGGWQKATCALLEHDDRSPSASVNESECRWHCWTCDKGGDAVDLAQANEECGFREAVAFVTKTFGGDVVDTHDTGSGLMPRRAGKSGQHKFTAPWTKL